MDMEGGGENRRVKRTKNTALKSERNRARKFRSTANFAPQNQPKKFGKPGSFRSCFCPVPPKE